MTAVVGELQFCLATACSTQIERYGATFTKGPQLRCSQGRKSHDQCNARGTGHLGTEHLPGRVRGEPEHRPTVNWNTEWYDAGSETTRQLKSPQC